MNKCPICKSKMSRFSTVKLRGGGGFKTIGHHHFCTNMNCHYEEDE